MSNIIDAFRKAMAERGLVFGGEIVEDGKLHRFKSGDDSDASAWYVLYPANPISAGAFGCWRRQINEKWHLNGGPKLSPKDLATAQRQWREAEAQRQKEEADRHLRMAEKAAALVKSVTPPGDHFYLASKQVPALGLGVNSDGDLVIPLADASGKVWSYQTIDALGEKLFMPGGRVRGCFYQIGHRDDGPLIICEGFATGASIHVATGWDVACAMNCGNLMDVAVSLRKLWHARKIVIAADDDRFTEGNPGVTKADEAARKISCEVLVPDFPDSYDGRGTDFNDLQAATGIPEVKAQFFKLLDYPIARPIGDLIRPPKDDPDELLKHRFLCRGGGMLLIGPTGIGKSSLALQMLALFSNGMPCFEIEPTKCLNSIYIQAENDDGDIADIRDGVVNGLEFNERQRATFFRKVMVHSETGKISRDFCDRVVEPLVASSPGLDLLVIDPAFSYVGAEVKDAKAVGDFLRAMLGPIIRKYRIAVIIVHHTNKPASGNQKPDWTTSELAYLGSGSIEWANWARAILAVQSMSTNGLFKLNAAKRGARLDWKDDEGKTYHKLIKHCKSEGVICWLARERRAYWRGMDRRGVWLVHCLVFHPEKLKSLFDVMTYGKYLQPDPPKLRYPKRGKKP